jgi:hypothetical protein
MENAKVFWVRLPDSTKAAVKAQALRAGMPAAHWVAAALNYALANDIPLEAYLPERRQKPAGVMRYTTIRIAQQVYGKPITELIPELQREFGGDVVAMRNAIRRKARQEIPSLVGELNIKTVQQWIARYGEVK